MGTNDNNGGTPSLDDDVDRIFNLGDNMDEPESNEDTQTGADTQAGGDDTQAGNDTQSGEVENKEGVEPPLDKRPARDAAGNILDENGNIIAGSRRERELFFAANRARAAATKLNESVARLEGENRALQRYADLPRKLGIDMAMAEEALQFRAQIESDPINAVRQIVARVLANGYTMNQLFGEDAPAAINAEIIKRTLDDRLKPIQDRYESEAREQQIADAAQRDLDDFLDKFPDAELHGELIAQIVQEHGISPTDAYYELKVGAARRGLDFTKPLREQVVTQRSQRPDASSQQRPTPGTHRPVQNGAPAPVQDTTRLVSPSTSFRDIVSMAMRSNN